MAEQLYPERIEIAYSRGRRRADRRERQARRRDRRRERLLARPRISRCSIATTTLGARYVGLVHNGDNDLARSAQPRTELGDPPPEPTTGVTRARRRRRSRALNRLGIMVDVSHGSKQTALDAMRLSAAPVIASHSGVASASTHIRATWTTRRCSRSRPTAVSCRSSRSTRICEAQPDGEGSGSCATLRRTVGLDGRRSAAARCRRSRERRTSEGLREIEARWPRGDRRGPRRSHRLRRQADRHRPRRHQLRLRRRRRHHGLDRRGRDGATSRRSSRARGYSSEDIAKIWSGNLLRVWREVERTAARACGRGNASDVLLRGGHAPDARLAQRVGDLRRALQLRRLIRVVRLLEARRRADAAPRRAPPGTRAAAS